MRKVGQRVRITVQLIDAETDRHLWAERYDRDLEDIFAIQDEVTRSIVATLPGRVEAAARDRAARTTTDNMAAYECVLTGKVLHHRSNREDNAQALSACSSARSSSIPAMPMPTPGRPACSARPGSTTGARAGADAEVQIRAALETALALDDNDSDVHRILAASTSSRTTTSRRLPPAARAQPESERRPGRRPAGRGADLARPAGRGHRLDPEGDAPQSLSPGALLEPPGAGLLRRPPLRRRDRGAACLTAPDTMQRALAARVPRAARRRRRAAEQVRLATMALAPSFRIARLPGDAALPRSRDREHHREALEQARIPALIGAGPARPRRQ